MIVLDRQHAGKPERPTDLGAHHDTDGDGLAELHEHEAVWTAIYGLAAEMALREKGYQVCPISSGSYPERHRFVNERLPEAEVYVALHLNAGARRGRGYSAVFYDYRSAPDRGKALAEAISGELSKIPEIGGQRRVWDTRSDTPATRWKRNAHSTIRGIDRAIGICYEPLFIDSSKHQPLFTLEGMQLIGETLAAGIDKWVKSRGVA